MKARSIFGLRALAASSRKLLRQVPLALALGLIAFGPGCGGGGGGGGGAVSAPTVEPEPALAFAANANDNAISRFTVDPETGDLSYRGFETLPVSTLSDVALFPGDRFLYATSFDRIYGLRIEGTTGDLERLNDRAAGANTGEILVHPDLPVIYVNNRNDDTISVFEVNRSNGQLSALETVPTGDNPVDLSLAPSGDRLYSVNRNSRDVSLFPVMADGRLGSETVVYTEPLYDPTALAFHPDGDIAYLTLARENSNVQTLSVDPTTGAFTLTDTASAGNTPVAILVDSRGELAFTANVNGGSVTAFEIHATSGVLESPSSASVGGRPDDLTLGLDEGTLYVGNSEDENLALVSVGANGDLATRELIRTRDYIRGMALREGVGTVPAPKARVYVPHPSDNTVYKFNRNASSGALSGQMDFPTGQQPKNIAFHPNGVHAYVVSSDSGDLEIFELSPSNGNLISLEVVPVRSFFGLTDDNLSRVVIEPSGRSLYVLDNRNGLGNAGRIFRYSIAEDGGLTPEVAYTTGNNPENLVVSPTGRYLYTLCSYGDQILVHRIGTGGDLTQVQSYGGLDRPLAGAFHPNGRWIYVTVENEGRIYRFNTRSDNGFIQNGSPAQSPAPNDTKHVVVHPDGDVLYVSDASNMVSKYSIDPTTGELTYVNQVNASAFWMEITPDGEHVYAVSSDGVQRFSVNPASKDLTFEGTTDLPGLGSYQRSLTLW